ncbi:MAG: DUF1778 domain-containing protein [Alphaproteobacteria bacterium]|nr:DUF1778 domain-containing protein [Alphaproteobacteria bacterium]
MSSFSDIKAPSDEKATDRIRMRARPSDRERIARDAGLSGATLAMFVRASAVREAERILREHRTTTLSERDSRALLEALDKPPPMAAARDAVREYRSRITNAE